MGAVFAQEILGVERPRVRLLSIGEEPEKGNQLTLEAHDAARASAEGIDFAGNAEGREMLRGAVDVFVTDGFTGNMTLKVLEGAVGELLGALREEIAATTRGQARRAADPAGRAAAAHAPRPGHLRRRVPARPARARGDRARQLGPAAIANAIRLAARGVDHRRRRAPRRALARARRRAEPTPAA